MERKTGENFDDKTAEDIFDRLRNVEGKVKSKKEDSKITQNAPMNQSNLLTKKSDRFWSLCHQP